MHAARDFDPATVRPRGGRYINGQFVGDLGHARTGDIEVRRAADNQPYGEIPDTGPEGVDQAVRVAQNALKRSRDAKLFFASRGQHDTQQRQRGQFKQNVPSNPLRL